MSSSKLVDLHSNRDGHGVPPPRVRWWSRVVVPAIVVLGVAALLVGSTWRNWVPAPTVRVETAIARQVGERARASAVVQAAGWLEAFPYQTHVTALADGIATEILVLEGDAVEAGQVVARLDATDAELAVRAARAELARRQAERQEAAARLEAARQAWAHPFGLERAKAVAEASVGEQQATIAEIEARIAAQTAVLEQARREAERASRLVAERIVSDQQAEQAQAGLAAESAVLDAQRRSLSAARERHRAATAELVAATRDLELRIADRRERDEAQAATQRAEAAIAVAEAALAEAELRLSRMTVAAPIGGIVIARYKAPGDKVSRQTDDPRSASIVSLYDPASLQARVDVPLADAGQIVVGQACDISLDVLPNRTFRGTVIRVLHAADIQKNTLQVKVAIEEPAPELRPEMLCRVKFLAQAPPAGAEGVMASRVFVPANAIVAGQVWLARPTEGEFARAEPVAVTADLEQDGWCAVDGVAPGALVVVNPPAELKAGQRIRVHRAADQGGQP